MRAEVAGITINARIRRAVAVLVRGGIVRDGAGAMYRLVAGVPGAFGLARIAVYVSGNVERAVRRRGKGQLRRRRGTPARSSHIASGSELTGHPEVPGTIEPMVEGAFPEVLLYNLMRPTRASSGRPRQASWSMDNSIRIPVAAAWEPDWTDSKMPGTNCYYELVKRTFIA